MRFATYSSNGQIYYGAVTEGDMIALSPGFPQWPSLREVIEAGAFAVLEKAAKGRALTHPRNSFIYEIPSPAPEKIICVGVISPP